MVVLTEMTRPDFERYLEEERYPVAILPCGSIEQHGFHLPLGTDILNSYATAKALAERTNAVVVPVCAAGDSVHHMHYKGTVSIKPMTLVNMLLDIIESLATHGIHKIIILPGHGGNQWPISLATREAIIKYDVHVNQLPRGPKPPPLPEGGYDYHGGPHETAASLHWTPNLVKLDAARAANLSWSKELQELLDQSAREEDPDKKEEIRNETMLYFYSEIKSTDNISDTGTMSNLDPGKTNEMIPPEDYKKYVEEWLDYQEKFINKWRKSPVKPTVFKGPVRVAKK